MKYPYCGKEAQDDICPKCYAEKPKPQTQPKTKEDK